MKRCKKISDEILRKSSRKHLIITAKAKKSTPFQHNCLHVKYVVVRKKTNNRTFKKVVLVMPLLMNKGPGVPPLLTPVKDNTACSHPSTRGSPPPAQKPCFCCPYQNIWPFPLSVPWPASAFPLTSWHLWRLQEKYRDVRDEKDTQRNNVELSQDIIPPSTRCSTSNATESFTSLSVTLTHLIGGRLNRKHAKTSHKMGHGKDTEEEWDYKNNNHL